MAVRCPACEAALRRGQLRIDLPFQCASCGEWLEVPGFYMAAWFLGPVVASIFLAYAAGFRDAWLWLAAALLWFPLEVVSSILMRRLLAVRRYPGSSGAAASCKASGVFSNRWVTALSSRIASCPACAATLRLRVADFDEPFRCPGCREPLRVEQRYGVLIGVLTYGVLSAALLGTGVVRPYVWAAAYLAGLPVYWLIRRLALLLLPVTVVRSRGLGMS
jgi:hypothetical protein